MSDSYACNSELVLWLDTNEKFQTAATSQLEDKLGAHIVTAEHPDDIQRKVSAGDRPGMFITDWIGVDPKDRPHEFVRFVRAHSPLTMTMLLSERCIPQSDAVNQLRRERLIDGSNKKVDLEECQKTLISWRPLMTSELCSALREYIFSVNNPSLCFLQDGPTAPFNMFDIYRAIVAQTEFGKEQERVWRNLLLNDESNVSA